MQADAGAVLEFWHEIGPSGWYAGGEALDATIRERFEPMVRAAARGGLLSWTSDAEGTLAYLVVTDQFPRNIYRNDPRAFATDDRARSVALRAIHKGHDLKVQGEIRQFFYLPFMHTEHLVDQYRCVALFKARMPAAESNLLHARAHREVIRAFGRFPYRNAALRRASTPAEKAFLDEGGYASLVRNLQG